MSLVITVLFVALLLTVINFILLLGYCKGLNSTTCSIAAKFSLIRNVFCAMGGGIGGYVVWFVYSFPDGVSFTALVRYGSLKGSTVHRGRML